MDAGLTWSAAMTATHQVADGFSATTRAEDHFTTSLDIGDHIARLILERCRNVAGRPGISDPWIVDVGAGSGTLLRQLIALGFPQDRLMGVDVRAQPADLDVTWVQGIAPDCVPRVSGLLIAHEFLDDIPADVVRDGCLVAVAGDVGPAACADDLAWLRRWTGSDSGTVGRHRDEAWSRLVARLQEGEAIAVDFPASAPVGHRAGRRLRPVPDGNTDICAGVELRSCRQATGGRIHVQHRLLAGVTPRTFQERAELAVLRDRNGLGAFEWLITEVPSVGSRA